MRIPIILLILLSILGCERSNMKPNVKLNELNNIPQVNWDKLANKKIYFGHQSVGFNIIEGIFEIASEMPNIQLYIKETSDPTDFNEHIFAHSKVGKNLNPISKCDDFKKIIESGVGDRVDIVFFKFCYVDISSETDIRGLFKYYTDTISMLKARYPRVKFIHFTVPLKANPTGIKAEIKKLLGRSDDDGNTKRNEFNQLLREKYAKENTLFDLAYYESGTKFSGSLLPEYTDDGGHLNDVGKKVIAKQLLLFLQSEDILNN
jgi:hypothetical protein